MDRIAHRLALFSALLGGFVLSALIVMTSLSVAGRALNFLGLGPVPGDFELVEAGMAFAVFAFLPIAALQAGHATVDIFTSGLGHRPNRFLLAIWETLFAVVMAILAVRLLEGTRGKIGNGEITLFLQFPVWWAYGACLFPAAIGVVVTFWSAWDRWRALITGRETRSIAAETVH
ncbi:MAG: TRAP transporter small permease subunit [Rhizobiaceae bacterium]